jgi:hypothetical protein
VSETLPLRHLAQATLLGLAVGLGWGVHSGWPRLPAVEPGPVSRPRQDVDAVPLPRFPPAPPPSVQLRPDYQPPEVPAGAETHRPPPLAQGNGLPPEVVEVQEELAAGKALYMQFLRGEGDRQAVCHEALRRLQAVQERLEELCLRYARRAPELQQQLEEATSYVAFLHRNAR